MSQGPIVMILAAGLGTRMKSDRAKVLHEVAGRPLVAWPVALAQELGARRVVVVLGHQLEQVQAALDARFGAGSITVARQVEMKGTGDAVRSGLGSLDGEPDDTPVVILAGDVPLMRASTVRATVEARGAAPIAVVTFRPEDPTGYGRIVRENGKVARIVEHKDASPAERDIGEVNSGSYVASLGFLRKEIQGLSAKNAQGELYLTDLVARAAQQGIDVPTVAADDIEVAGVNTRVQLAELDAAARRSLAERWMLEGVTMVAPDTVAIDADVTLGRDVRLGPSVHLRGRTRVADGATIDVGCVITDSTIEAGANIKPYCVITDSAIGARAQIGPFSHCRPGTELAADVHLGNFVETKKARFGAGAKANHLAYLGDVDVGAKSNIGAGTITCNYDGTHKHKTTIGAGVFIGSDTQLVAPVTVGDGAYVGAGTTVTIEVPPGALAVSRVPQKNVEGYVERKKGRSK